MIKFKMRTQIMVFLVTILLISFVLITLIFSKLLTQIEIANVEERLNVALQTAWDQIVIHDSKIISKLSQSNSFYKIDIKINNRDYSSLHSIINDIANEDKDIDYITIVNKHGEVLASNNDKIGGTWYFSYLLKDLMLDKTPLRTSEIYPEEMLLKGQGYFRNKAFVPHYVDGKYLNTGVKDALMGLVILPILDEDNNFEGCIATGSIYNNNQTIAEVYTKKVPNTYLSIGFNETRIISNISIGEFHQPIGTIQEHEITEVIEKGERYSGKVFFPNNFAIVVMDPILNNSGEVVGNIGVGAPVTCFKELDNDENKLYIAVIVLVIFIIAVFIINCAAKSLTDPIFKLRDISKKITHNQIDPQKLALDKGMISVEIRDLANSMFIMAKNLDYEKKMQEERVIERTKQLALLVEELESANKCKSQFLANISHELRTPLTSILGFADLLQDPMFGELNEKQIEYLNTIMSSSKHLLELINDLLVIIKLDQNVQKVVLCNVNVVEMLEEMKIFFYPQLHAKNLELHVECTDCINNAFWDEKKVKQIIINLLSNAIKFTPEGGIIELFAEQVEAKIKILVKDNGIGVPKDMQEKVFLAFEQADTSYTKQYRGVGLGLAISKSLVELHNGTISLADNQPNGTIITVILPINPF